MQLLANGSLFVHVLDSQLSSRSSIVGIIGGAFQQQRLARATVVVTFRGSDTVLETNVSRGEDGLTEMQRVLLGAAPLGAGGGCTIGFNARRSPRAGDVLVITGDLDAGCGIDESWSELGTTLATTGVRAFWVGVAPRAPPYATGVSFSVLNEPVLEYYSAFARHLSLIVAVRCTGAVSFTPAQVPLAQRSLLTFVGVCDASLCCVGDACSPLVSSTGQRVSCYTPVLLRAGQFVVTVVARDGRTRIAAAGYLTVVLPLAADVAAARDVSVVLSGASWAAVPLPSVTVTRIWNLVAAGSSTASATRCCRVVALSGLQLDVVGGVESNSSQCLNATEQIMSLSMDASYPPLLTTEIAAIAVQCITPQDFATNSSGAAGGRGDVVWSVAPQSAPSGAALVNSASDLPINWGRLKRRRVDAMLQC